MKLAAEEAARKELASIVAAQEAAIAELAQEAAPAEEPAAAEPATAVQAALQSAQEPAAEVADAEPEPAPAAEETPAKETVEEVIEGAKEELAEVIEESTGADEKAACELASDVIDTTVDQAVEKVAETIKEESGCDAAQAEPLAEAAVAAGLEEAEAAVEAEEEDKEAEEALAALMAELESEPNADEIDFLTSEDDDEWLAAAVMAAEVRDAEPEEEEPEEESSCLMNAIEQVEQVCVEQGADDETAAAIAESVVEEAAVELAAQGLDEEEVEDNVISLALYDLTAAEVQVLQEMEDQIFEQQAALAEVAAMAETQEEADAAIEKIETLESFIENLVEAQEELEIDYAVDTEVSEPTTEEDIEIGAAMAVSYNPEEDFSGVEEEPECAGCINKYVSAIEGLTDELEAITETTDSMAASLAEIDPNTENAAEGKALLRKMYKLRGVQPGEIVPVMPETPEDCVPAVAGKVLQLEQLEEDITKAVSFRDFFAEVYCMAYVNSLVTMTDGLSQIFPGGLDWQIEEQLQRVYGPFEDEKLDMIEIAAVQAYLDAVESGEYVNDDSSLLGAVEPLEDALNLCDAAVIQEVEGAQMDREDYLYDLNFLTYLRTL